MAGFALAGSEARRVDALAGSLFNVAAGVVLVADDQLATIEAIANSRSATSRCGKEDTRRCVERQ
jgi:hypothetical protein